MELSDGGTLTLRLQPRREPAVRWSDFVMRWRDTTGLMRWNRENRRTMRRRSMQSPPPMETQRMGLSDDELIAKAAAIRADWEKAHNDKVSDGGVAD